MDKLGLLKTRAQIVLASESKPRAAVLRQTGLPFDTAVSGFMEDLPKDKYLADEYAVTNATIKAKIVSENLQGHFQDILVVIGCDTVVEDENRNIIEKPENSDDAKCILRCFSGKPHKVITGVSLVVSDRTKRIERSFSETTVVKFAALSEQAIEAYVDSGEPMNKAGAYGIQGLGSLLVENIQGDYNNVVGLPLYKIFQTLSVILEEFLPLSCFV